MLSSKQNSVEKKQQHCLNCEDAEMSLKGVENLLQPVHQKEKKKTAGLNALTIMP